MGSINVYVMLINKNQFPPVEVGYLTKLLSLVIDGACVQIEVNSTDQQRETYHSMITTTAQDILFKSPGQFLLVNLVK